MPTVVTFMVVTTVSELLFSLDRGYGATLETMTDYELCCTDVCKERAALLKASINVSVEPCDDFFSFVCDGWIANHTIPPDEESYGTFEETDKRVQYELKELIENVDVSCEPYNITQKAAILYKACMENNFTEFQMIGVWGDLLSARGFNRWPIVQPEHVPYKNYTELLTNTTLWPVFYIAVAQDIQDKSRFIIELDEMPFDVLGREQLVNSNATERNRQIAKSYVFLIATAVLILNPVATITECLAVAEQIFKFESELAKAREENFAECRTRCQITLMHKTIPQLHRRIIPGLTTPPNETLSISARYKKITIEELEKKLPKLRTLVRGVYAALKEPLSMLVCASWNFDIHMLPILASFNYEFSLANITINKTEHVAMFGMNYFEATIQFLETHSLTDLYNFVAWRRVCNLGLITSIRFARAYQELMAVAFGIKAPRPRWQYCLGKVAGLMPFVVGELYVRKNFAAEAKNDVEIMLRNITNTFRQSLCFDTWMDTKTRDEALQKLSNMTNKIGYPNWIYDNAYMESRFRFVEPIHPREPFARMMAKYWKNSAIQELLLLRSTPNKTTMWPGPAIVNAYYSFGKNEMDFPAGILRDAFYRAGLPASVNYGGIGSVIGHEMIHSFDNQGSQYDEEGRLRNWWTNVTREMFEKRAECFVNQYSSEFSSLANRTLDGVNTLGENIADNGGLRMAFRTLSAQLNESVTPDIRLPGLEKYTPRQLFFISNAMVWCGSIRKEALQLQIEYDPHAPRRHRVNVSLRNMKSFTAAFQCKEGQRMHYKNNETCTMW